MHVAVEVKFDSCSVIISYVYEKGHLLNITTHQNLPDFRRWTNILKNKGKEKSWNLCETHCKSPKYIPVITLKLEQWALL